MAKLFKKEVKEVLSLIDNIPPPKPLDIQRATVAAITCKSDREFAEFLEIDVIVFKHWCNTSIEYHRAVRTWRNHATNEVEVSLAKRAIGFKKVTKKDVIDKLGNIHTLETESYYPPDPTAAQFWLKNRAPEDWKDKSEVDVNVNANIRAWLIAAGEEVQSLPGDNAELIEGQAVFVGISEEVPALNVDEPLNITPNVTSPAFNNVVEQEPEQKAQANEPGYSLFND